MNQSDELNRILEGELGQAIGAREVGAEEASARRDAADMPGFFDASLAIQLPDIFWAREDWDSARREYERSANLLEERRTWNREHSGADYPLDASSDWEAAALIKAGRLHEGRDRVGTALSYWRQMPQSAPVLLTLALHAAQAGMPEGATLADEAAAAIARRPLGEGIAGETPLLHHAPTQSRLLLGDWEAFESEVDRLNEAAKELRAGSLERISPFEQAVLASARGFDAIRGLRTSPARGDVLARDVFESAMVGFYRSAGRITSDLYFMRLNVLIAERLANGQKPNPNPFARI